MAVELSYIAQLSVVETLETNVPAAAPSSRRVTHNQFNTNLTLNAASTPPVSKVAAFELAADGLISLVALPGTNGATVNGSGLKLRAVKFIADPANVGNVVLSPAGNPYSSFWGGNNDATLALGSGQEEQRYFAAGAAAISAGVNETLASVDLPAGGKLKVMIVLG